MQGQPEGECRTILLRRYLAGRRRGRPPSPGSAAPDAGEQEPADQDPMTAWLTQALSTLTARQRAVLVLRHVHGYAESQTAEAVGTRTGAVAKEHAQALAALRIRPHAFDDELLGRVGPRAPTIEDLQRTLDELAEAAPAPDSRELLAAAQAGAGRTGRRRRGLWLGVGAAVLALGSAGLVLGDPVVTSGTVQPAVPDPDYAAGYGVVDGVVQPFTASGLRLLESHQVTPRSQWYARLTPSTPEAQLYAVARCPGAPTGGAGPEGVVTITTGSWKSVSLPCTAGDEDTEPQPLPPGTEGTWTVDNVSAAEPVDVAIYEESAWEDFPFPSFDTDAVWTPPQPAAGVEVIDASSPILIGPDLEAVTGGDPAHWITVPMTASSQAELRVTLHGPGQLLLAIDDVVVSNDGEDLRGPSPEERGPWQQAEPDLRRGFVHSFEAGASERTFRITGDQLVEMGVGLTDGEVVISAVPRAVRPDDWAVHVFTDRVTPSSDTVLPAVVTHVLPDVAFGLQNVAEFEVPADGRGRQVDIDPRTTGPLTWVAACPPGDPSTVAEVSFVVDETRTVVPCGLGDPWLGAVSADSPSRTTVLQRPVVSATAGVGSLRIAAYEPVAWQDYPFERSTATMLDLPVPRDGQAVSAGDDGLTSVFLETDRVGSADLADGQAVLALEPAQVSELIVETTGVGRVRLEVLGTGQPVGTADPDGVPYGELLERDGWWSSWTAEPSRWVVPALIPDGTPVQEVGDLVVVTVEGYAGGSVEVAVLSLLPAPEDAEGGGSR